MTTVEDLQQWTIYTVGPVWDTKVYTETQWFNFEILVEKCCTYSLHKFFWRWNA